MDLHGKSGRYTLLCGLFLGVGAFCVALISQHSTRHFIESLHSGHCLVLDSLDAVLHGRQLPPEESFLQSTVGDARHVDGVLQILRSIQSAEKSLDPSSPEFAPLAAARAALPRLLLAAEADAMAGKIRLLTKVRNRIERMAAVRYQKCLFCTSTDVSNKLEDLAALQLPPRAWLSQQVEAALQDAAEQMPSFSANSIFDRLIILFNTSVRAPMGAADRTSRSLRSLQVYNTVEAALVCLGLCGVFLFLMVCYIKQRRSNTMPQEPCSFCTLLHIIAAGVLLAGSIFLALRAFVGDRCAASADDFANRASSGTAESLASFLGQCLPSESSGNILEALGMRAEVLKPRDAAVRAARAPFSVALPPPPRQTAQGKKCSGSAYAPAPRQQPCGLNHTLPDIGLKAVRLSTAAAALVADAQAYGGVFLPDSTNLPGPTVDSNSRLKVPKEFLSVKRFHLSLVFCLQLATQLANYKAFDELQAVQRFTFSSALRKLVGYVVASVLQSGIQVEDETVELPEKGTTMVYGLKTLQGIAAPWVLQPLAGGQEGPYIITETYPSPHDEALVSWLKQRSSKAVRSLLSS